MYESIGDYEYTKKDLIGHGAFAIVYKGRYREVRRSMNLHLECLQRLCRERLAVLRVAWSNKQLCKIIHDDAAYLMQRFVAEARSTRGHQEHCQEELVKIKKSAR